MRAYLVTAVSVTAFALTGIAPASAGVCGAGTSYTTIDIATYVNNTFALNPTSFPQGCSTGNEGTGIPFLVPTYPNNTADTGTWLAPNATAVLTVNLASLNIVGVQSFYALLNNYYGNPVNEYNITINFATGGPLTFGAKGGVDTRDYNYNPNTTQTIAATTTPWFNNNDNPDYQRLDVREFNIPANYATDQVESFVITQTSSDLALFTGLTFSSNAAVSFVPEPASLALLSIGLASLGMVRRRRA